jgi:hypothetical protein
MAATGAILLDCNHAKSLLRRAKATFYGVEWTGINPLAVGMAFADLEAIIAMGGEVAKEAEKFKSEIKYNLESRNLKSTMGGRGEKEAV